MRKPLLFVIVGIVAGLAVGASGALATRAGVDAHVKPATDTIGLSNRGTEAIGGASTSEARMAALINGSVFAPGPPPNFGVVRSVGVENVTNPEEGTFCIKPDPSIIPASQISKLIPTVTASYVGSAEFQVFAQYVSPRPNVCQVGTVAVTTFSADSGGNLDTADNDVAFTIVVD